MIFNGEKNHIINNFVLTKLQYRQHFMKKNFLTYILIACLGFSAIAQESKNEEPNGKAIIQVFGNFHSGFGSENDDRGFELDRSYLGYQYSLDKSVQIKAVMDIGQSNNVDDYHRIAYIKNAQVSWATGRWRLDGGLIATTQFKVQEKFWGYRYIMKSFQDEYKFGSSADLGISASYNVNKWLSADAIIVNGEGYKKVQKNDGLLYGLGATITPLKGITIRLYGSLNEAADKLADDSYNWATFIGYKHERFSIGAEYNIYQNYGNTKDADLYGVSVYATAKLSNTVDLFARYDNLSSKDDWNLSKDESATIIGAQFKAGKYVKIAPNFRMSIPSINGADNKYSGYISCYFGF